MCVWQSSKTLGWGNKETLLATEMIFCNSSYTKYFVFWITGATPVVFVACARMLSPFPGYGIWKDYEIDTKQCFIFPKICFSGYRFHICTRPCNMSYYCSDSGSQIFCRSDPHMGFFALIYWCGCTVQPL